MSAQSNNTDTTATLAPEQQIVQKLVTITVPEGQRHTARVKWFDNSLSYGFATITSGEHAGRDIFVHQSNILTLSQGIYRTLRMGEYIEFNLEENAADSHRYQAIAVTGPGAGQLMCESNPRRPRTFQPRTPQQPSNQLQTQTQPQAQNDQQPAQHGRQSRRGYQRRAYNNAPIQVVVEYTNPPRQQRRAKPVRQNNSQTSQHSAAANIAATLAAGTVSAE